MSLEKFEVGQGVLFHEVGEKSYGVVMFADSNHIKIAPVYMIRANTKCYNDVGAVFV